jgi:hypothetical protein
MSFLSNPFLAKQQAPVTTMAAEQTPKPEDKKPADKPKEPAKKAIELV